MTDKSITPLKILPPPKPTILSTKKDPRLPEQTFKELRNTDDIVEKAIFPYTPTNREKAEIFYSNFEKAR